MREERLVVGVQRITSAIPGAVALKRRLHNSVIACGVTYWCEAAQRHAQFALVAYHRISERVDPYYGRYAMTQNAFEAQLRFFKRFCSVLSLDEIVERLERAAALPPRCVALTFDDGYRDMHTVAWPLLKRYQLPAILFAAVEAIERGSLWPDRLAHLIRHATSARVDLPLRKGSMTLDLTTERAQLRSMARIHQYVQGTDDQERVLVLDELAQRLTGRPFEAIRLAGLMLSWEELRALAADGCAIGAHSITHPVLTQVTATQAEDEILESRRMLEQRLGRPVEHFAYPFGQREAVSPDVQRLVKQAGFRSACTSVKELNDVTQDHFALKRLDGPQGSLRTFTRTLIETGHSNGS